MPQAKTRKKKPTAKVGGGGVGTRVSKLNLKIVIPIVVVVAALGGFYIFQKSSASSSNTFSRFAKNGQIAGGTTQNKNNGDIYVFNDTGDSLYSWVAESEYKITREVCANFRMMKDGYVLVVMYNDPADAYALAAASGKGTFFKKGSQSSLCTNYIGPRSTPNGGKVQVTAGDGRTGPVRSAIMVDKIWGKP